MSIRIVAAFAALGLAVAAQAGTYLALGDSIAYGLQPDAGNPFGYNVPSNGDRGYVSILADAIGAGGTRPTVLNYAIPQESSTSFRNVLNPYRPTNTNYVLPVSQFDYAVATAGGGNVSDVSFALGANDVLTLLTPAFLLLPKSQQDDQIDAALATFRTNTASILGDLRAALPSARLFMPGYYSPYPAASPLGSLGTSTVAKLNADIQILATTYNGRYVDFASPIAGKELLLTHIAEGDIHPNDAGYAALGAAAAQAVPEPAPMAALGLGALIVLRRRRR